MKNFFLTGLLIFQLGFPHAEYGNYSLKILDDGKLDFGQEYIHYHIPYGSTTPGVKGMAIDAENLLYSSTAMGIQLSDQLGRVNFIFSNQLKALRILSWEVQTSTPIRKL